MNDALLCQSCGAPLTEQGVLGDKCLTCLLELGLAGKASEPGAETRFLEGASSLNRVLGAGTHVGHYRIIRPIGEGGMGAVRYPGSPSVDFRFPPTPAKIAFSPDGLRLSAGDLSGIVAHWDLWSAAADTLCMRVWRNLSIKEWQAHVGEGIPYERTCPALPPGAGAPGGPQ